MTGATQPSVEDLVMGAIPGLPQVKLHNPFLAYENGDEFLNLFRRAAEGRLEPFILVVEGSIPDEGNKQEGCWASFGADRETGQPIPTCEWVDRLAPKAWAVVAVGTCAAYGGIHAMQGNVTGAMGLLLLYGLHPVPLETRVMGALDKVRPYLDSHGGNVELLGVADGVVRLRLQGSCKTCPSSAMTLKLAIEEAVYAAAPDVAAIEAEGVSEPPKATGFVQIGKRQPDGDAAATHTANGEGRGWEEVSNLQTLGGSSMRMLEVRGRAVLFCRLGDALYAYGNDCPGCGEALDDARLEMTSLVCTHCGQRYDLIRAGRGLDQPSLHLEPFPLLVEQGRTKVALPN